MNQTESVPITFVLNVTVQQTVNLHLPWGVMMMPKFSEGSLIKLATCHPELRLLFTEVIKQFDCVILEGHRNEAAQETAYRNGKTKVHYPHGKHNATPSLAADVAPYPIDWKDVQRFHFFAGFVVSLAMRLRSEGRMTMCVRWGGDWDSDLQMKDETFRDLVHFELREG